MNPGFLRVNGNWEQLRCYDSWCEGWRGKMKSRLFPFCAAISNNKIYSRRIWGLLFQTNKHTKNTLLVFLCIEFSQAILCTSVMPICMNPPWYLVIFTIYLSICLSVCLSIYLSIYLSIQEGVGTTTTKRKERKQIAAICCSVTKLYPTLSGPWTAAWQSHRISCWFFSSFWFFFNKIVMKFWMLYYITTKSF